jgi:hypothetical protein
LTTYLLKLEIVESLDRDYYLPKEELTSPAVFPPMPSLTLENFQGYPQTISIEAFGDSGRADVTVQDVLRAIHENLRMPCSPLGDEERAETMAVFKGRCKSEEERSEGLRRIDHLGGRDRLQILPKIPRTGPLLPMPTLQSAEFL